MGRITLDLLRKRAEHNEGMVSTLEEIALHQQNIEKIELLGHACRHLKILYLQNNLIAKIQNLHRLKELEYVNLALNNITKVQNLQRCESLTKLDLTVNFIPKAGLLSLISLQHNLHLRDLYLTGNPCTEWSGYRAFVVASLPQLQRLDGEDVKRSERIAAEQRLPELQERLRQELRREGIDPDDAAAVEDDFEYDEDADIPETGYMDEKGEMRRPWCRETRLLEHRETERQQREAEERKKASERPGPLDGGLHSKPRLEDLPEIADGERLFQKNEGRWEFWLEESEDGQAIQLEVKVGKFLDTSLIKADVRPGWVRLLIKGRLLQLQLPCEVMADASTAKRSKASGSLLLTMPKEDPMHPCNVALLHPAPQSAARAAAPQRRGAAAKAAARAGLPAAVPLVPHAAKTGGKSRQQGDSAHSLLGLGAADMDGFLLREVKKASVQWVDSGADADDDDDFVPQLC